jgi:NAD+ kinase
MKFPFKTIALIGKHRTPDIAGPLLQLAAFLSGRGVAVLVDARTAEHLGQHGYRDLELSEMGRMVDLAIVLGGDGTLLNIACALAPHKVPLVGVNQGRLGFLTDISLDNMLPTIGAILEGKFVTEQRMVLQATVLRGGQEAFRALAFNEVVMHRGNASSMMEFEVSIDSEYLYNQRADGLIAATPTGSTAYALSAGGPIVHSALDLITLVPVCPHTLSNRPIVLKSQSQLEILVHRSAGACLRFDSHSKFDLQENDKVAVSRYPEPACLLHPVGHSYYHTLREKLLWNKTL